MSATGAIPKASAGLVRDAEGEGVRYTLTLGGETITLEPGRAWIQADAFKWVTRGLLEEPQSYHVTPDGTVEIPNDVVIVQIGGVPPFEMLKRMGIAFGGESLSVKQADKRCGIPVAA